MSGEHSREGLDDADEDEDLNPAERGQLPGSLQRVGGEGLELGEASELGKNAAESGKHGDASILDLALPQPLQVIIITEAERVKAKISRDRAVARQVLRPLQEGDRLGHRLHGRAAANGSCEQN